MKRSSAARHLDRRRLWRATRACSAAPSPATTETDRSLCVDQFLAARSADSSCSFSQIERKHEVELAVGIANQTGKIDFQLALVRFFRKNLQLRDVHSRFPAIDCFAHAALKQTHRHGAHARKDKVMNATAKLRPHQAFARRRREQYPDRFLDVLFH